MKGVSKAVNFINTEINETIQGFDVTKQTKIDRTLIELDGTSNKSRLGANSILQFLWLVQRQQLNFENSTF